MDDSGSGRSKAATTLVAQEAIMEARSHTSYRDGRGWKVPLSSKEAVQVREAKNLCDSATYQKTKERKLTLNLSFNFK